MAMCGTAPPGSPRQGGNQGPFRQGPSSARIETPGIHSCVGSPSAWADGMPGVTPHGPVDADESVAVGPSQGLSTAPAEFPASPSGTGRNRARGGGGEVAAQAAPMARRVHDRSTLGAACSALRRTGLEKGIASNAGIG